MVLSGIEPSSDAAKVRKHLAAIEAALADGVSRQAVYDRLVEEIGIEFSFEAFCVALKRARAKAKKQAVPVTEAKAEPTKQETQKATPEVKSPIRSSDDLAKSRDQAGRVFDDLEE